MSQVKSIWPAPLSASSIVRRSSMGSVFSAGDAILGLPSSGLHTNGYSLARRVLADLDWDKPRDDLDGETIGEALLDAPSIVWRGIGERCWAAGLMYVG